MKILHTADWHLDPLTGPVSNGDNLRMIDTVKCMNSIKEYATKEQPDLVIIAGDITHTAKQWCTTSFNKAMIISDWLEKVSKICPIVLVSGTPNHTSPKLLEILAQHQIPNVYIAMQPTVMAIQTKSGLVNVAGLPAVNKQHFREQHAELSVEEENIECSKLLGQTIIQLAAAMPKNNAPNILVGHHTILGSKSDIGKHIFRQNEVVLTNQQIDAGGFDLACFGHIHRPQQIENINTPTFYGGSINRISFNEENQSKGFYLHTLYGKNYDNSEFIDTPARKMETVRLEQTDIDNYLLDNSTLPFGNLKDSMVRVHYECDNNSHKQLNKPLLEKQLYQAGVFYVSEIKRTNIENTLVKKQLSKNDDIEFNVDKWLKEKNTSDNEIAEIQKLAVPYILDAQKKLTLGKATGIFAPISISVHNYRLWKDQYFDFTSIDFASINGVNGCGKSSLFMDAIVDCLYEEPREENLTGWINSTKTVKSGSIEFTFKLGETIWRVNRHRTKSGSIKLILQEQIEEQWLDRSEQRTKDTQKKIIALLGMDVTTFKSCVLIMQDAYGVFLEANKDERMQVLSNILGLGIYDDMQKNVKSDVTDINREIKHIKADIIAKEETIADKTDTVNQLEMFKQNEELLEAQIKNLTSETKMLERDIAEQEHIEAQISDSKAKIGDIRQKYQSKERTLVSLNKCLDDANLIIESEEEINTKVTEYETVKKQITVMSEKERTLNTEKVELENIRREGKALKDVRNNIKSQITAIDDVLTNETNIKMNAKQYDESKTIFDEQMGLRLKDEKIRNEIMELEKITDKLSEEYRYKYLPKTQSLKESYEKSISLMDDCNCIDIEKANCKFLKDAKEAKNRLAKLETEMVQKEKEFNEKYTPIFNQVQTKENEQTKVGYNCKSAYEAQQTMKKFELYKQQVTELEGKKQQKELLLNQLEEKHQSLKVLSNKFITKENHIKEIESEIEELPTLKKKLHTLETYKIMQAKIPAAKKEIELRTQQKKQLQEEIINLKLEEEAINKSIRELRLALLAYENKPTELALKNQELKVKQKQLKTAISEIAKLETIIESIKNKEAKIKELATGMKDKATKVTRLKLLGQAFDLDGIPLNIIESIIPEIESISNDILGNMTNGRMEVTFKTDAEQKNGKAIKTLDVIVSDYLSTDRDYKSFSGGEKVRVALAVTFGLAETKANRAGLQLGFMGIDEPPFLDGNGIDSYVDALETMKQRHPDMKIWTITHIQNMKSRFFQTVDIEKDSNGSRIVN